MSLELKLREELIAEAKKLIDRFHAYHNTVHREYDRNTRRISNPPPKEIHYPEYWHTDRKFNPFYVHKKARSIARSIAMKIEERTYAPNQQTTMEVPKASGGVRTVKIFQVPDAAVSKLFYKRLLAKNKHRFSSFSYAYRNDRNVQFAVQDVAIDVSQEPRTFVAEFDFHDFFGSISHEYLLEQLSENGFAISDEEMHVIQSFLPANDNHTGIPQGTAISLFLANVTCWRLDRDLENQGLRFARYADDTVVWSTDYQKICCAFSIMSKFAAKAGVMINYKKSEGISLLTKEGLPSELRSKSNVNFLGYSIGVGNVSIKQESVRKIKKHISYLLYRNLLQPLKGTTLTGLIIPSGDQDKALVTAIMQIRRYMYGGLSSIHLRNYISGRNKRIFFKGIMSFYPLVDDVAQLRAMDGWLASTIYRCIQRRAALLNKWGHNRYRSFPFNVYSDQIIALFKSKPYRKLYEIPSFMLIYRVFKKGIVDRGMERIINPFSSESSY